SEDAGPVGVAERIFLGHLFKEPSEGRGYPPGVAELLGGYPAETVQGKSLRLSSEPSVLLMQLDRDELRDLIKLIVGIVHPPGAVECFLQCVEHSVERTARVGRGGVCRAGLIYRLCGRPFSYHSEPPRATTQQLVDSTTRARPSNHSTPSWRKE